MMFKKLFLSVAMMSLLSVVIGCGSGGGGGDNGSPTGTVNTTISDPPICKSPNGSIDQVWVTITRVRAHTSNNAGPDGSGWIDLVDLRNAPKQIDLLSLDSPNCVLTELGSTSGLPTGQYQQIRLYLLSNSPGPGEITPLESENKCLDSGYNCVVSDGKTATLLLSSEAQTGIKIPSGQIAGGKFTVVEDGITDLNIDFDACSSIVRQGNGQYRLKPVLHAGEISLVNNSISGRVVEMVDETSSNPIPNALVLVEQRDPYDANLNRVMMQKTTGSDGRFIFCPLFSGPYDIVAAASNNSTTYNATVTLSVPVGTNMGDIPLEPEAGAPAQIDGQITSAPNPVDFSLSALQEVVVEGADPLLVTIPLFEGSTPNKTTEDSESCPTGTFCTNYTLYVPASNPKVGTFPITPSNPYTDPADPPVNYGVNAQSDPACTSESTTPLFALILGDITYQDLSLTGCGP